MHAVILVGKYRVALANDEAFKWPVALTNAKFSTTGIFKFIQSPDADFGEVRHKSFVAVLKCRVTRTDRTIAGTPMAAAYMKKPNQPIHS